ncbi:ATP-dependent helicase HepA [Actinomadura rubrobrunea]|uniref:ATP-dependent helicase HepA n=1 Tax=Actinomadura rubrobrunea TaxID=115335 RepID=A0A9W6UTU6_9ACTN|nr:helicase-related protein [Actinomadura rubrobrunea]GLW62163.1 ATP-dependent helicase HepA [Actinomadura rubrobrunea]
MAGTGYAPGSLVTARGREWVVLPESTDDFIVARPLNGDGEFTTGLFADEVEPASFPRPTADPRDIGDSVAAGLLRTAMRIGFTSAAGPFRSLASIAVEPRQYQLLPLLLALRMDTVRLLIADDVGIGKTVEAALIAKELLEQGEAERLTVLCSPALAEQWQAELRDKFAIDATLVLPSTVAKLQRGMRSDESLFEKYPYTVVSTDFIKAERRRALFLRSCPDLVIVDEAHTCVPADGAGGDQRQKRYELLSGLAQDPDRHLVLVTATPHSGKEDAFRDLIGLLDPELAKVDLETEKGRDRLARHYVQRRRRDIRRYLDENTLFPEDRQFREEPYEQSSEYAELMRQALDYARKTVNDRSYGADRRPVRWWSALALLRSMASSPRAAAETLQTRAAAAAAETPAEADRLGAAGVMDLVDDEAIEGIDAAPGADDEALPRSARDKLRAMARTAKSLEGPEHDAKLAKLIDVLKELQADGYDPIVFCKYIPTAEYVAEHLAKAFGRKATVASVTGTLPPSVRLDRIERLTKQKGRRILVATDCLAEGINLQEHFQAVVHYDLAWNPTRHEQREGRVDRFGQRRKIVRAVTLYGIDNGIDGVVLDVLIRKHATIARQTGVAVPVPERNETVVKALVEGLLLRDRSPEQLAIDIEVAQNRDQLHREWESAAARESKVLTKYAHSGVKELEEVRREATEARTALGRHTDVARFVRESLSSLGGAIQVREDGFTVQTQGLPIGVRHALGLIGAADDEAKAPELVFRHDLPVSRGEHALVRTDPAVVALARYVVDAALDPEIPDGHRPARRCGAIRTRAVTVRTTLLLVRYRFHLHVPGRAQPRALVAEDAQIVAYHPTPEGRRWLDDEEVATLLGAGPDANVLPELVQRAVETSIAELGAPPRPGEPAPAGSVQADLDARGHELADRLLRTHRRVRSSVGAIRRGLKVIPHDHADVLGVYVYLPAGGGR